MGLNLDKTKLTPEELDKLEAYENSQAQLQALNDIASMVQELIDVTDDGTKNTAKLEALGAILTDSREQLIELNKKEAPEAPDYAKPVVEAVNKLEKAIKAIEVKPEVKVDAPQVNVDAPSVNVDLKGVEKILKTDIPNAFKEAIAAIPEVEIPETVDRWDEVIKWLKDIDTASRMKPQYPVSQFNDIRDSVAAIQNIVGREVESERYDYASSTTIYTATAVAGSSDSDYVWTITKYDLSDTSDASGKIATNVAWDNRATETYS